MIRGLTRALDNLFGRGDAAVTVPPLDGALRPNRVLDEATSRWALEGADCLAACGGTLFASAGESLYALGPDGAWEHRSSHPETIAGLCAVGEDGLAIARADGRILIEGGSFDGRSYRVGEGIACITALAAHGSMLYVANGSAANAADDWQRDLLERNASGSVWCIDLAGGAVTRIADGLAWPAGLVVDGKGLVVSEAWKHRLVRIDPSRPGGNAVLHGDLPGYPGRIVPAKDGYWLAMFAPRSQLVEFVLREDAYRKRMMAEVPQHYWVAPKLRSGRSFYESLQGGGVKQLGMLKPWAPTMSAGLCVKLDRGFQPRSSLQSRADGRTHGVTCAAEHEGQVFVAARGDGVIVSLAIADMTAGGGETQ
ncbi:strictosidine synthase [Mesorhizobium sp. PUT5]|uniref:strictosidine synthase n=1 Tax=Mesorhizobium sp. PUT5 TaxID=3454629 RepID=UPI003FA4A19A